MPLQITGLDSLQHRRQVDASPTADRFLAGLEMGGEKAGHADQIDTDQGEKLQVASM
jgi:hypothetical protein